MTCILAAVCAIENAMELYVCKGAADGTDAQKLTCCKGIFGLQADADLPRKLNPDSGVTGSSAAADTYESAKLCRTLRLETMIKIRATVDEVEAKCPANLWTYATYKELLFLDSGKFK